MLVVISTGKKKKNKHTQAPSQKIKPALSRRSDHRAPDSPTRTLHDFTSSRLLLRHRKHRKEKQKQTHTKIKWVTHISAPTLAGSARLPECLRSAASPDRSGLRAEHKSYTSGNGMKTTYTLCELTLTHPQRTTEGFCFQHHQCLCWTNDKVD